MIQVIINRMAANSFMLKGWAVTLVAAIFALAGKNADQVYFLAAYIPVVVFWGLDSYYLLQERLYRSLYEKVRKIEDAEIDFSMQATTELDRKKNSYRSCVFSKTELWFYLPLALVSTGIIVIASYLVNR
ncbi:MAG: hypothetical protein GX878_01495 [Firmicutes bacterium]|nr:hypothetical protein [Bacillota bacterium]